jgi:hypothetical protein
MKQEMAIHRYKIQNTRFTHEAFIVIKREFTRYKMSGKYEYLSIYPISNQRRYLHTGRLGKKLNNTKLASWLASIKKIELE